MQFMLSDRLIQKPVAAEISATTDGHVQYLNSSWIPAFQRRYHAQERDDDFLMWNLGDGYFDHLIHSEGLRSFTLIVDEKVEGVLLLQRETRLSRLEPQHPLVYVSYLATAPWNRRDKKRQGRLRGVGTLLMAWAARESRDVGCDGRLGLHSLRGSDNFYHLLGLHNLGLDAARRGMTYFEMGCPRAREFFETIRREEVGLINFGALMTKPR